MGHSADKFWFVFTRRQALMFWLFIMFFRLFGSSWSQFTMLSRFWSIRLVTRFFVLTRFDRMKWMILAIVMNGLITSISFLYGNFNCLKRFFAFFARLYCTRWFARIFLFLIFGRFLIYYLLSTWFSSFWRFVAILVVMPMRMRYLNSLN